MLRYVIAVALVTTAACSAPSAQKPATSSWAVSGRVILATGTALDPDSPTALGIPAPEALAYVNSSVYVVLGNLDPTTYQPAGPSWLSVHDGQTLARTGFVPLVNQASPPLRCTNAGAIRLSGDVLLVACAGAVTFDPTMPTTDGTLVFFSVSQSAVQNIVLVGRSPGSVLQIGNDIWMGDLDTPTLLHVDGATGAVLNGVGGAAPVPICATGYASDLAAVDGRAFASCFNDNTVQEFDPVSGALIGAPLNMGQGPVHMAGFTDRIAVVDSLSGTLSFVFPTTPATAQREAILVAGEQGGDDVEGVGGNETWAGVADSGFGTLVIFDVTKGFQLSDAVDMKDTPSSPSNDPYGVAIGDGVFYVSVEGWSQPGELIRVAQQTQ